MNLDPILKQLFQGWKADKPSVLEWKIGQVVTGAVLRLLGDGEALLSIGGQPVRACLTASLEAGQTARFQVSPESDDSRIVLRLVPQGSAPLEPGAAEQMAASAGLPNSPEVRKLIQQMASENLPLKPELVADWHGWLNRLSGRNAESRAEWLQTLAAASRRGITLEGEPLGALHRALFGEPLHASLDRLSAAIGQAQAQAGVEAGRQGTAADPAARLLDRLASALESVRRIGTSLLADHPAADGPVGTASGFAAWEAAGAGHDTEGKQAGSLEPPGGNKLEGKLQGSEVPKQAPPQTNGPAAGTESELRAVAGNPEHSAPAARPLSGGPDSAGEPLLRALFRALGVSMPAAAGSGTAASGTAAREPAGEPPQDGLRRLLAQAAGAPGLPQAVRELADHVGRQIDGQQLLMQGGGETVSQLLMLIPLNDGQQGQTASVQIQSRRNANRTLDIQNCRLFFDLSMQALGSVMMDMLVQNQVVTLTVYNDHPDAAQWIQGAQQPLAAGLRKLGYRYSGLRLLPVPSGKNRSAGMAGMTGAAPQTYRGMDVRI